MFMHARCGPYGLSHARMPMFLELIWKAHSNSAHWRAPVTDMSFDCSAPGRKPISALSRYVVKLKPTIV